MTVRRRARVRETNAPGNARKARRMAEKLVRSGESGHPAERRGGPGKKNVRGEPAPVMYILPGEKKEVFLDDGLDVGVGKMLADGSAMFVKDDAGGLIQHFP